MYIKSQLLTVLLFGLFAQSLLAQASQSEEKAIFAGGCFWCMEPPFDKLKGVSSTISGYTGGTVKNPDYKAVTRGRTGHYEAIEITYDPSLVSYERLLEVYWLNIDPLDALGQFCDKGSQYLSGIFYLNDEQKRLAELSLKNLKESAKLPGEVVTEIMPASTFYPAEEYHQDYYIKNPIRYKFYRTGCGRDRRLFELWGEQSAK